MPRDLHPSLSAGPIPKPICVGCSATDDIAVLAPIRGKKTICMCATCAGFILLDVHVELMRRAARALSDAIAPEVLAC